MRKIRILLADDHAVLRQGIAQVLESQPDMEVVAQAKNGVEALALAEKFRPDIALVDINMPEMDGVETTRRIKTRIPTTQIIILTMYKVDNFIFEAIKAGANGYLLKEVEMNDLIAAVRSVSGGEAVLDSALAGRVLGEFRSKGGKKTVSPHENLAPRDIQILSLLAQGLANQEIAEKIAVSEKTVRNRLSMVFKQLHLNNRTEAALYAIREGIAETEIKHKGTNVPEIDEKS